MPPCFTTISILHYFLPWIPIAWSKGTAGDREEEVHVRSGLARGIVDYLLSPQYTSCPDDGRRRAQATKRTRTRGCQQPAARR